MANILQVTTPNVNDNRNIINPQDPKHSIGNQAIRNPVDPTRVVRGDGRDGQGNTTQDALFSVVDYESNYGAFIKGLGEEGELAGILERLMFTDMAAIKDAGQAEVVDLVEKFLMSMRMDSPEDLLTFLQGQGELQAKFSGDFFDKLRSVLTQSLTENGLLSGGLQGTEGSLRQALSQAQGFPEPSLGQGVFQNQESAEASLRSAIAQMTQAQSGSEGKLPQGVYENNLRAMFMQASQAALRTGSGAKGLQEAIMAFLKGYNNYSSGGHLLQQMRSLTDDIQQLLLRPYREDFRGLVGSMNWEAPNGETAQNAQVLNKNIIPFLSSYISQTHDYGAVREATMLLIFHAARYQDGDMGKLEKLFDHMINDREFVRLFKGNPQENMEAVFKAGAKEVQQQRSMADFADGLSGLLLKGANGKAGLENVQQFYTIMNGMLLNESVYMPLLHFILPFQYEGNNVMSEMWVDPDSEKDNDDGERQVKLFLKFNIQSVGKFELVMTLQSHEAKVQLFVPPQLANKEQEIRSEVGDILKDNGIRFSQLMVRQRVRDRRVDEVFPEIREKERTINVRI